MADNVGAVILAAGMSSRMGSPKALLPFGNGAVIDRVLANLQGAGVSNIVVVTGCGSDVIARHLAGQDVEVVENHEYQDGMFSSVCVGIRGIMKHNISGFFLTPVDCPLISVEALSNMVQVYRSTMPPVVYPVYCGKKGHPLLIHGSCASHILTHNGDNGLKGALEPFASTAYYLSLAEATVITDMDTPDDYRRDLSILEGKHQPNQLFLQGDVGIGKSYLINSLLIPYRGAMGGFYVNRRIEQEGCTGFVLCSVREDRLPKKEITPVENRVFLKRDSSGWQFVPEVFDIWAAEMLRTDLMLKSPLLLLDEIGGMELNCPKFCDALYAALRSGTPCIGVYKHQNNSVAQSEALNTGKNFSEKRKELVLEIASLGGRIVTLTTESYSSVEKQVQEFLSNVL